MANVPYPITGPDLYEMRMQIQELIRQLFEEKIGGADLGDVFSLPGDVLTLVLADDSGLTKTGNELAVDPSATGGLNITSGGLAVKLADNTLTLSASGLSVTSATTGAAVTVTDETTYGLGTSVGTGTRFARNDHTHGTPDEPFPVGSYYFNATGTDPNTELGYGTWTQVAQGQFLVGAA